MEWYGGRRRKEDGEGRRKEAHRMKMQQKGGHEKSEKDGIEYRAMRGKTCGKEEEDNNEKRIWDDDKEERRGQEGEHNKGEVGGYEVEVDNEGRREGRKGEGKNK